MSIKSVAVEPIAIERMLQSIHQVDHKPLVLIPRLRNDGDRRPIEMVSGSETASEILRSQEGIGESIPPPTIISTDSFAAKAEAEKPWISDKMRHVEEFIRHKQEALGGKRLKAISAAKDSFVLKHTTAVNCQVSISLCENNVHGDRY
jgi:hypothetical protein